MPKKKAVDELQNKLLLIFSLVVAAITYIYCFPYVQFFSGFISSPAVSLLSTVTYIGTLFLLVACAVVSISRIFIYRKELKMPTKMMLCVVALCAGGVIPLSIGNRSTPELTYLHGFRIRIQRRLDADAIRKWMQDINLPSDEPKYVPDMKTVPAFIKKLDSDSVLILEYPEGTHPYGSRPVRIAIFHWRATGAIEMAVGPPDINAPIINAPMTSESLQVGSGVYLWSIPK